MMVYLLFIYLKQQPTNTIAELNARKNSMHGKIKKEKYINTTMITI